MNNDKIQSVDQLNENLTSVFRWMPYCAAIVDTKGNILDINLKGLEFFKKSSINEITNYLHIRHTVLNFSYAQQLINAIGVNRNLNVKNILIQRFDKTIASIDVNASLFPENPNLILVLFSDASNRSETLLSEIVNKFQSDVTKLRPYLNKPGKEILEQMIDKDLLNRMLKNKKNNLEATNMGSNFKIAKLMEKHPKLSINELILCRLLSLKISNNEISNLTGKTPNSIRVSYHRIIKKLNLESKNELLKTLEIDE